MYSSSLSSSLSPCKGVWKQVCNCFLWGCHRKKSPYPQTHLCPSPIDRVATHLPAARAPKPEATLIPLFPLCSTCIGKALSLYLHSIWNLPLISISTALIPGQATVFHVNCFNSSLFDLLYPWPAHPFSTGRQSDLKTEMRPCHSLAGSL